MFKYLSYLRYLLDAKTSFSILFFNILKQSISVAFLKIIIKTILCNDRKLLSNKMYIYCNNCESCLFFIKNVHNDLFYLNAAYYPDMLYNLSLLDDMSFISKYKVVVLYNFDQFDFMIFNNIIKKLNSNFFFLVFYKHFISYSGSVYLDFRCHLSFDVFKHIPYYLQIDSLFFIFNILYYKIIYRMCLNYLDCKRFLIPSCSLYFFNKTIYKKIIYTLPYKI